MALPDRAVAIVDQHRDPESHLLLFCRWGYITAASKSDTLGGADPFPAVRLPCFDPRTRGLKRATDRGPAASAQGTRPGGAPTKLHAQTRSHTRRYQSVLVHNIHHHSTAYRDDAWFAIHGRASGPTSCVLLLLPRDGPQQLAHDADASRGRFQRLKEACSGDSPPALSLQPRSLG